MENIKITIIVAIYNTEKYIDKCIKSLLNQSHENLEIFLINDGSNDKCEEICLKYASQDNRVTLINKENGGQASARNIALELATGDWVGFVDSDDWVDEDMYKFLLSSAISENSDIIECGWKKIDINGRIEFETQAENQIIDRDKALFDLVCGDNKIVNTSVCNKLFKRSCVRNIRFPEVRAYEDDEFIHKAVWNTKLISIKGDTKYNYLTRPNSTMTSKFNLNKLALVEVQRNICEFLKEINSNYYYKAQKTLCSKQFYMISCLLKNSFEPKYKSIANEIENSILKSYSSYINNPIMGKNKLVLKLLKFFPIAGRIIIKFKF